MSELELAKRRIKDLTDVAIAMRDWIDAVPADVALPAMPGFDRDWADNVILGQYDIDEEALERAKDAEFRVGLGAVEARFRREVDYE